MGFIRDKLDKFVKKATETATETVKEITKDEARDTLDILAGIAKIGIFVALTAGAIKGAGTVDNVVSTVKASEAIEPIAKSASPIVQIFLGEGKGVHIK